MKAVWNGAVLAETEKTEVVEGNHYFPPDSLHREYFQESNTHTVCGGSLTSTKRKALLVPRPQPLLRLIVGESERNERPPSARPRDHTVKG
jgi:hypothetical protein